MLKAVPGILAQIVEQKKRELGVRAGDVERRAEASMAGRRDFARALDSRECAIIAEIKQASPSQGTLAESYVPAAIAQAYEQGGAAALSVLTDEKYFHGSLADLDAARAASALPVLRKDFTIDRYHVLEAAAHGADAILLIAAILSEREMRDFRELAGRYQMAALVEVHDQEELDAAVASGARILGVNNRNLHTFQVDLAVSLRLAEKMPGGVVKIAESGIHSRDDIAKLRAAGYDAFLIGEHLMKSGDPARAVRALLS
ncbi:MAG TPA: indole-3-glycerol phosphate synthase TrpC [Bryobacteraceae bacterium]|nr:indole-3-glycerol phosphate synthase TrpC [Bryobacteraceae bacterium]